MCRKLTAEEIEVRVGQKAKSGDKYSLLLYKTSRTDMALLDEIYGPNNWTCKYDMVGDSLFCTISVWDKEKNQWISKQSNGSESNVEAEKGKASDAMKRSGFLFGIGRELYSAPKIWVEGGDNGFDEYTLDVAEIGYDDNGKINKLIITGNKKSNGKTNYRQKEIAYQMGGYIVEKKETPKLGAREQEVVDEVESKLELKGRLEKVGVNLDSVAAYFKKKSWSELTVEELKQACKIKNA